ncbi:hypothetical protein CMO93_05955 [Candidatus Woesearchaeota archaeon]|nr:hypothetical protein [Candidatus Woesearchaeota archaeon]|tara:strand:+ start:128 stop:616 length:489 start_codon:yes stop_codon:yes gene_type:complete
MYNLLLDSDALIKLTHSEIIFKVCEAFNCSITNEVKEETVKEGKARFYPDALIIENLIKNSLLNLKSSKKRIKIKENFGKGEKSILELYHNTKNNAIVSDDSTFIKHLENENIPFFVPSDLIILLKKQSKINQKEAFYFLEKMKVFIREEVYNETKKELKEV